MSAFDQIISPFLYESVQSAISTMIASEIVNQKAIFLAADPEHTEKQFNNDYSFTTSNGLYFPKDIAELPLLNVYFEKFENNGENENVQTLIAPNRLNLDMMVYRADALQEDETIIDGSTGADKRLNYMGAQVWRIMEAQVNRTLQSVGIVDGFSFVSFVKDVNHPNAKALSFDTAPLFARMSYDIKITESKEVNIGETVNEFFVNLELDEQAAGDLLITGV